MLEQASISTLAFFAGADYNATTISYACHNEAGWQLLARFNTIERENKRGLLCEKHFSLAKRSNQ
jgi:hypothetical protein